MISMDFDIGELCAALYRAPDLVLPIAVGWGSDRGDYSRVGVGQNQGGGGSAESVHELAMMLESAVGETMYGYKGGEYEVSRHTEVVFSNYGECRPVIGDPLWGVVAVVVEALSKAE